MTTISIRIPADLIEEMQEFAPLLGFSGYQALVRSYIGEGLRRDEALFAQPGIKLLGETLRKNEFAVEVIEKVIAQTLQKSAWELVENSGASDEKRAPVARAGGQRRIPMNTISLVGLA